MIYRGKCKIYLDNAATTLMKPKAVRRATAEAIRTCGGAGRGKHVAADRAAEILYGCRLLAAELFHAESPERIVFTMNATHSLNIAINSLLAGHPQGGKDSSRVLVSGYEHNSVLRPLAAKTSEGFEIIPIFTPPFEPELFMYKLEREIEMGARAVVCTHVSNVFGYILPIERVDALCSSRGIPLIIDASQSAGCLKVDAGSFKAAKFICMPGHKGLMGPQGTGILICSDDDTVPLMSGGTGTDSLNPMMPEYLPERLEAGTPNVHGIAGLAEGLKFILKTGTDRILEHEKDFILRTANELESLPAVVLFKAERLFCQTGVLSMVVREGSCEETAEYLAQRGICVRAGLHCSPLAHKSAGTLKTGTLRISASVFNRPWEAARFAAELKGAVRNQQIS